MIINIETYADFDIPVTYCLMDIEGINKSELKDILSGLEEQFSRTDDPEKVIRVLKRMGAVHVKSYKCTIGGDL